MFVQFKLSVALAEGAWERNDLERHYVHDGLGDLLIGRQNFTPEPSRIGAGALTVIASRVITNVGVLNGGGIGASSHVFISRTLEPSSVTDARLRRAGRGSRRSNDCRHCAGGWA